MRNIRKASLKAALALTLVVCLLIPAAFAAPSYPSVKGYLTDTTGSVSSDTAQRIGALGEALERLTTAQAVVAVVNTLQETDLEEYATGLFRQWGLGNAQKNNGVLLLIALEERKARIEVGYGLEGALPDGKCGRILDEALIPYLRIDELDNGIEAAYDRLIEAIADEYSIDIASIYGDRSPIASDYSNPLEKINLMDYLPILIILIVAALADIIFNRGRILRAILWALLLGRGRGGRGGGRGGSGGGGFRGGGGSSGGGGASRGW